MRVIATTLCASLCTSTSHTSYHALSAVLRVVLHTCAPHSLTVPRTFRLCCALSNPPANPPAPLDWIGDDSKNGELFDQSDFVVVCTPLLNSTVGLVDKQLLSRLSRTGVLINSMRSPQGRTLHFPLLFLSLSLHPCPPSETCGMFALSVARGPIVDEDALYHSLLENTIGGAVLDVWWKSIRTLPPAGVGSNVRVALTSSGVHALAAVSA